MRIGALRGWNVAAWNVENCYPVLLVHRTGIGVDVDHADFTGPREHLDAVLVADRLGVENPAARCARHRIGGLLQREARPLCGGRRITLRSCTETVAGSG